MTATEARPTEAQSSVLGTRRTRKEDPRLLTGEARFVDDLVVPGALWMGLAHSVG